MRIQRAARPFDRTTAVSGTCFLVICNYTGFLPIFSSRAIIPDILLPF